MVCKNRRKWKYERVSCRTGRGKHERKNTKVTACKFIYKNCSSRKTVFITNSKCFIRSGGSSVEKKKEASVI